MIPRRYIPILSISLIGVFGAAVGSSAAGENVPRVLAVYPFSWSSAQAMAAASNVGSIVDIGPLPFIVTINSDKPGLARHARAHGAWLVLDADRLAGCKPEKTGEYS